MLKHIREALKVVRARHPEVLIEEVRQCKHFIFNVKLPDGRERTVACSGSPRDSTVATRRTILELERVINEPAARLQQSR